MMIPKSAVRIIVIMVMMVIIFSGCEKEYPYEVTNIKDYQEIIPDEMQELTTVYALDNNEFAMVFRFADAGNVYSVVILDSSKEVVSAYSCEADSQLMALNVSDEFECVTKIFGWGNIDGFYDISTSEYVTLRTQLKDGLGNYATLTDTTGNKYDLNKYFDGDYPMYLSPDYNDVTKTNFRVHLYDSFWPLYTLYYKYDENGEVFVDSYESGCW